MVVPEVEVIELRQTESEVIEEIVVIALAYETYIAECRAGEVVRDTLASKMRDFPTTAIGF